MANVTCWLLRPQFTRVPEFPHKKVDRIGYVSKFCVRDYWDVGFGLFLQQGYQKKGHVSIDQNSHHLKSSLHSPGVLGVQLGAVLLCFLFPLETTLDPTCWGRRHKIHAIIYHAELYQIIRALISPYNQGEEPPRNHIKPNFSSGFFQILVGNGFSLRNFGPFWSLLWCRGTSFPKVPMGTRQIRRSFLDENIRPKRTEKPGTLVFPQKKV